MVTVRYLPTIGWLTNLNEESEKFIKHNVYIGTVC